MTDVSSPNRPTRYVVAGDVVREAHACEFIAVETAESVLYRCQKTFGDGTACGSISDYWPVEATSFRVYRLANALA
ncbi:hypothetical protein [Micromonospora sp. CA-248212]|uniref:hypothetical protein n=1 Tax=Micromonospora sp. CA-248212 TaxID=3239961 RepID=UPI003D8A0CC5